MSEVQPRSHNQDVTYWSERYASGLAEGAYCERKLAAAALRELDGVDE